MGELFIRTALLAILLAVAACGGAPAAAHQLIGTIHLSSSDGVSRSGSSCAGTGGYDDFRAGTQVTVKNEAGAIIGSGSLEDGVPDINYPTVACNFSFTIKSLPDAKFYSVEVSHRGALTYSKSDLEAKGWMVAFSIGS